VEAGAVPLDRFADGLRASHEGAPGHLTALGHSYGSVVFGNAASDGHHLAVDDIVTAGSPGMDVHRAGDLNVGARHVWAGTATDDPIASPATAIRTSAPASPAVPSSLTGSDRNTPSSGATSTTSTPEATADTGPQLPEPQEPGRVVVGFYDQVGLDYGEVPR
jgi:hypothetical protein